MSKLRFLTTNDVIKKIKKGDKDFSKCKIIAADFSGMDLSNANFESSELEWARFADCKLIGANFTNAKIDLSYFSYSDLTKAVFEKAKIYNNYFGNVIFNKTNFKNADIRYVLFVGTNIGAADFSGASKIRMLTSFTELTQDDFNFIMNALEKVNLPLSHRTFAVALLDNVKTLTEEKLLKFYDMGRKAATTFMRNVYSPASESGGIYSENTLGAYTNKGVYRPKTKKKKGTPYK